MNTVLPARRRPRTAAALCCLALFALCGSAAALDSLVSYSNAANPSVISRSLGGAGTAMPLGGFQALVNPALAAAIEEGGVLAAGYGRGQTFDKVMLPFGALFNDGTGALGLYYRYLNGKHDRVHDATLNLSGRMFEQMDAQGPVEFGVNIRYENIRYRREDTLDGAGTEATLKTRGQGVIFDVGFYQPHVLPWLDFSLLFANLNGYHWTNTGGEKSKGWIGWRHSAVTIGGLITIPAMGESLIFQIPLDLEIANLFTDAAPTKYITRTGIDARILQIFNLRFGYAHAPENPIEMMSDFDHKNLFFGGVGVFVKPIQVDFFAGKNEFGVTVGYWY